MYKAFCSFDSCNDHYSLQSPLSSPLLLPLSLSSPSHLYPPLVHTISTSTERCCFTRLSTSTDLLYSHSCCFFFCSHRCSTNPILLLRMIGMILSLSILCSLSAFSALAFSILSALARRRCSRASTRCLHSIFLRKFRSACI